MTPRLGTVAATLELLAARRLARPIARRDPAPWAILGASFVVYFVVGQLVHGFGGHGTYNLFFNADCPRVIDDVVRAHVVAPSGAVNGAHPLFVLLTNPIGAVLARFLSDGGELAALLLVHAAGAGTNALTYVLLRRLGARRGVATLGAGVRALSTCGLVFGSVVETSGFATLAIVAALCFALRPDAIVRTAIASAATFACNVALAPHALLAAPALALGRPWRRFVGRVAAHVAALAIVLAAAFTIQAHYYPSVHPFERGSYTGYGSWWHVPHGREAIVARATLVAEHVLAYSVVAPRPGLTAGNDHITTFMQDDAGNPVRYDALGGFTAGLWLAAMVVGAIAFARTFRTFGREPRAFALLCFGWLSGVAGFFLCFGDDLMLHADFWIVHVVVGVALGAEATLRAWPRTSRFARAAGVGFALLLAASQAVFLLRTIHHYASTILLV